MAMGLYALAIKAYDSVLLHSPPNLAALLRWSHALRMTDLQANDTQGTQAALQRLAHAAEQYPELTKRADFFKELTECYLVVDWPEQAHQLIQQAIQMRPQEALFFLLLAQTLLRLGQRARAAADFQRCLQLLHVADPELVETARSAHAELAAIAAADGNIELLISELTATLLLPPPGLARLDEHVALWCALATALERAGRIAEALDACERAERAVGPLPRILISHAYLLLLDESRERAEAAVQLLLRVVNMEPDSTSGSASGAAATTAAGSASNSANGAANGNSGISAKGADANGSNGAENSEDTQGDFLPWCLLGKAHTILASPRAAYDAYQIALRRASSLPITWLAVGKLYLELKQLPDALAAYSQALRLQLNENLPGTAAAWDGLSCVYERCDDQLGDAADACSRAAACFRSYGDIKAAEYHEQKADKLLRAAKGEGPVPELSEPLGVPNYFLRDLVTLLPSERIAFVLGFKRKDEPEGAPAPAPAPGQNASQNGASAPAAPSAPTPSNALAVANGRDSPKLVANALPANVKAAPQQTPQPPPPQPQLARPQFALPQYDHRFERPVHNEPPRAPSALPHSPPQPQFVHAPHVAQGMERGPPPMYALAYPYKPESLPMPQQLPPVPGRHVWLGPEHMAHQPPQILRGPPPFAPPPAPPGHLGLQSPPQGTPQPDGAHRLPMVQPPAEGYSVVMPPGYVYGQYMPMHSGMLAQVQPYGAGGNWRW